ncbi:MAG: hypothetical protein NXI17_11995 [Alphaproteobacteria bacterium]|nr:hypothetical protein [Alphaproteobacteria bacterium]
MKLSSPSFGVFIISVVLFALVIAVRYLGIAIPVISGNTFEMLLVAYVAMLVGVIFGNI